MECLFGANGFDPTMHIYQKLYGCFLKSWYPKIHFKSVFHYKPSILGYPYFWKHPYIRHFIHTMLYKVVVAGVVVAGVVVAGVVVAGVVVVVVVVSSK